MPASLRDNDRGSTREYDGFAVLQWTIPYDLCQDIEIQWSSEERRMFSRNLRK